MHICHHGEALSFTAHVKGCLTDIAIHFFSIGKGRLYLLKLGYVANSWDEWVGMDRLMKHTEENVLKQQALDKKQGADKNLKSVRATHTKPKISSGTFTPLLDLIIIFLGAQKVILLCLIVIGFI